MISEAAPPDLTDYSYAKGDPLFEQTTVKAFKDAVANVLSVRDIPNLDVYLTTAVKCGKTRYGIATNTIKQCSMLLEKELALFPNAKAFLLMGDVAIKAVNYIALRASDEQVIPAGSTYKIRRQKYLWHGRRVFLSYLQAGPSFFIGKNQRKVIAEYIAEALRSVK